jgi:hypothetical protein
MRISTTRPLRDHYAIFFAWHTPGPAARPRPVSETPQACGGQEGSHRFLLSVSFSELRPLFFSCRAPENRVFSFFLSEPEATFLDSRSAPVRARRRSPDLAARSTVGLLFPPPTRTSNTPHSPTLDDFLVRNKPPRIHRARTGKQDSALELRRRSSSCVLVSSSQRLLFPP